MRRSLQLTEHRREHQAEQRREQLPERRLVRLREQRAIQQRIQVRVEVKVEVEIEPTTQLPKQVSTQVRIRLQVLPDEQRQILLETQPRFQCWVDWRISPARHHQKVKSGFSCKIHLRLTAFDR